MLPDNATEKISIFQVFSFFWLGNWCGGEAPVASEASHRQNRRGDPRHLVRLIVFCLLPN